MIRSLYAALTVLIVFGNGIALAQSPREFTVALRATFNTATSSITLRWPQHPDAKGYEIYRKGVYQDKFPTTTLMTLDSSATSFVDAGVTEGQGYEYRVFRLTRRQVDTTTDGKPVYAQWFATGYIAAGSKVVLRDRGRALVLVDTTMRAPLRTHIDTLTNDLTAEGWTVTVRSVERAEDFDGVKVKAVRDLIKAEHASSALSAILLVGRVAVPYSGNIAPDGHRPDHLGAWPADGIYGDINGNYNDAVVNAPNTSRPINSNIPGDGKFDPSTFTTPVDIPLGRVDFYDMPAFASSELNLLKAYFVKNHAFRSNAFAVKSGGIIDDNFGTYGEVFAASAWRSFAVFGGDTAVKAGDFFGDLAGPTVYQFAYGCGGGTNTSASGVGTTDDLATKPVNAIFTLLFGSYFGDWGTTNNLLRASIASNPRALTCGWSGRPHWYLHHMALGEPIGHGFRISQNNEPIINGQLGDYIPNVIYVPQGATIATSGDRMVHIALMGDPTLRAEMIPVPTVASAIATTDYPNKVNVSWTRPSKGADAFLVYRKRATDMNFTRLSTTPVTTTSFQDSLKYEGNIRYRIVCLSLRTSASGSYFDMGQGVETSVVTTGVAQDQEFAASVEVSPNPTSSGSTFGISLTNQTPLEVTVHDLTGLAVWSFNAPSVAPGTHVVRWDGLHGDGYPVAVGRYIVRVVTAHGVTTKLLSVVR